MKLILKYTFLILSLIATTSIYSQTLNWKSIQESRHLFNINAGWDYGTSIGVAYGTRNKLPIPAFTTVEYSFPFGKNIFDDFKIIISERIRIYEYRHFALIGNIGGIIRRYENNNVTLLNFGSDLSVQLGYYKKKWFVAANLEHDKAIITRFKHSAQFKESFPEIKDGWYEPPTGGNISYGLQAGYSIKKYDFYFMFGKVVTDNIKTKPFIPFYFKVGFNYRLGKLN